MTTADLWPMVGLVVFKDYPIKYRVMTPIQEDAMAGAIAFPVETKVTVFDTDDGWALVRSVSISPFIIPLEYLSQPE